MNLTSNDLLYFQSPNKHHNLYVMLNNIVIIAAICDAYILALLAFPTLRHVVNSVLRLRAQLYLPINKRGMCFCVTC